ncbi:MAG: hypothetical protein JRF33_26480 [Deltaproteobacteria bacterium]|nr:hypothetical protein [Deltaproteobacteria bacterium]
MKKALTTTLTLLAVLASGSIFSWCTGAFNSRDMADALASEFDEWLDVDGGETVEGEPPAEGDTGVPAIISLTAPQVIGPGHTDYDATFTITMGITDPADVQAVILHVLQANSDDVAPSYIRVPWTPLINTIDLDTVVHAFARLPGNAFHVRLGLQHLDGTVGNYVTWNVVTVPATGEITTVPQCLPQPYSYPGYLYTDEMTGELTYSPPSIQNVVSWETANYRNKHSTSGRMPSRASMPTPRPGIWHFPPARAGYFTTP